MTKIVTLLTLVSLCLFSPAIAQDRLKGEMVKVRFVSVQKMTGKKYTVITGKTQHQVEISSSQVSPELEISLGHSCQIKRTRTRDVDIDQPVLATFTPKPHIKQQLVVLLPKNDSSPGKWHIIQLDIGNKAFKGGERYAVNLSSFPIVIRVGNSKTSLAPRKTRKIIEPKGKDGDFLRVVGAFNPSGTWKLFMSSRWIRDAKVRSLMFIYPESRTQSLSWHGMSVPITVTPEKRTTIP